MLKKISSKSRKVFSDVINNFKVVKIKYWWVILLSAALHRLPFAVFPSDSLTDLKKACMILSYLLLFWALSHNLNFRSIRVMALGTLLNFVAIAVNGGLMPVSPEARELAHMSFLSPSQYGMALPEGSGIFLPLNQTNLWFITDIIPAHRFGGVYSVGDLLIGFGFVLFFLEVAFSKKQSIKYDSTEISGDNLIVENKLNGFVDIHPIE